MKFTLEIKMGNEAMQTYGDIRGALGNLRMPSASEVPEDVDEGYVRDENGNTVGRWYITE